MALSARAHCQREAETRRHVFNRPCALRQAQRSHSSTLSRERHHRGDCVGTLPEDEIVPRLLEEVRRRRHLLS